MIWECKSFTLEKKAKEKCLRRRSGEDHSKWLKASKINVWPSHGVTNEKEWHWVVGKKVRLTDSHLVRIAQETAHNPNYTQTETVSMFSLSHIFWVNVLFLRICFFFYWEEAKVVHVSVEKCESSHLSGFLHGGCSLLHVERPKRLFIINAMF